MTYGTIKESMRLLVELQNCIQTVNPLVQNATILLTNPDTETPLLELDKDSGRHLYLLTYLVSGILHKTGDTLKSKTFLSEGIKVMCRTLFCFDGLICRMLGQSRRALAPSQVFLCKTFI